MEPERGSDEEFELDESLARGDVSVLARMFGGDQSNELKVPRGVVEIGIHAAARMDTRGSTMQRLNILRMFLDDESVAAMRHGPEYDGKLVIDVALEQACDPNLALESPSTGRVLHPDGTVKIPSIYCGLSDQQKLQLEWDLVWENVPVIHLLVSHGARLPSIRGLERTALGKFLWRVAARRMAIRNLLFYWMGCAVERVHRPGGPAHIKLMQEWANISVGI